ncbi:MAG: CvpA family protein [Candidatus Omnitrophota bacterium]|nr:CvpA family protein [Candidatus Omnitrophota bacterium]
MPSDLITNLNWVDILIIIAIIRIVYIGVRQGLIVEFSKVLGLIFALMLSFHYYKTLSNLIHSNSPLPIGFSDLICFNVLLLVVVLIFKFIREGLGLIVKVESASFANTWGGLLLGGLRAWIFSSILIFILLISGFSYIEKSARQSYGASRIIKVAPAIYSFSFESIISKFFPSEKINNTVFDVVNNNQGAENKTK